MNPTKPNKILVQCDFDGTITEEDISFMLLDSFAHGDWRTRLKDYEAGKISVGRFNREAFAMIKASRKSILKEVRDKVRIRPGFPELVAWYRQKGFRFVIVSNGLDFYINETMADIGLKDIEVFAARTNFQPGGLKVQYIGPGGRRLEKDFKGAFVNSFLDEGYRITYMGNGSSDFSPAQRCHYIFATGTLLERCRETQLNCVPFSDFNEVIEVLKRCQ